MDRNGVRRVLRRAAVVSAAVVAATAATGFVLQQRRDTAITEAHPPPGEFVEVDGHRLHYRVRGAGPVTFVLEAGAGEYSGSWGELEDGLARLGRVFTYDRAGLGWSEPGPRPRTLERLASELREALTAAEIPSPRVFLGHSLGGAIVARYATAHPSEVAAMLLLDPSHPGQFERLSYPPAWQRCLATQALRLAPLGVSLLLPESPHPVKNRSGHLQTYAAELRSFMDEADSTPGPIDFGAIPLVVLSRAPPDPVEPSGPASLDAAGSRPARWQAWTALHAELVAASSSDVSRHVVVEGAGHCVHCDRPDAVIRAARELRDVVTRSDEIP